MDIHKVKQLIEEVLATYLPKKRLLVVHPQTPLSKQQVETLKGSFEVQEWSEDAFAGQPIPTDYDAKIFLEVDQQFISSSAQGLATSPEMHFLADLLIAGEKVLLIPNQRMAQLMGNTQENAYIHMLKRHQQALQTFGCNVLLFSELVPYLNQPLVNKAQQKQRFITAKDIEEITGAQLVISSATKLTPLALDLVKEKNIRIQRES